MSTLQSVLPLVVDRPLHVPSGVEECSRFSMFNKKGKFYVSMPCGKWDCPVCNPKVARGVRIRMEQSEANKWTVISHIVLTVHGKYESSIINQAFNDLMTFIRRGGDFPFTDYNGNSRVISLPARPNLKYIRVPEIQMERMENTGDIILHLHIVFNQRLTKYDLIPIWQHALKLHGSKNTFNYVNDTHPKNINAGKYLFKYFTKYECQELFEKGARRYSSSRGVIPSKPVKPSSGEWVFMRREVATLIHYWYETVNPTDDNYKNRSSGDLLKVRRQIENSLSYYGFPDNLIFDFMLDDMKAVV